MLHSNSQENTYREQGLRRLSSILKDYKAFVDNKLQYVNLSGRYDFYLKKLSSSLADKIKSSIDALQSSPLADKESESRFLSVAASGLLEYYHLIIELTQGAADAPKNLYFFADEIFSELGGREIPYLIKAELRETIPSTYEVCKDTAKQLLINFSDTSEYLTQMRLHVICISPTIINNPLDWVLIGHEIAHILEKESLKIVQLSYPQLKPTDYLGPATSAGSKLDVPDEDTSEPKWCLELACDLIAATAFGPIYAKRLIENFLKPSEPEMSLSHPFWKLRIRLVADELNQLGWRDDAKDVEARIDSVKLANGFPESYTPRHWNQVRDKLRQAMKGKGIEYRNSTAREKLILTLRSRLGDLKPCTSVQGQMVDPRDILNAAEYMEEEMKTSPNFRDFLGDMIRLAATEKQYNEMKARSKTTA